MFFDSEKLMKEKEYLNHQQIFGEAILDLINRIELLNDRIKKIENERKIPNE